MRLYIFQRVLHDVVLRDQILQFATVGVLLDALRDDAETVKVDQLVLRVLKVVSTETTHTHTHNVSC